MTICPTHRRPMEPSPTGIGERCPHCVAETRTWLLRLFTVPFLEPQNTDQRRR